MLVREIYRIGYFDKVVFDGYTLPFYNNDGLEIKPDSTVIDCIEDNAAYSQGVARLRINIAGEAYNTESATDILRMRKHREKDMGLKRYTIGNIDRYYIGYVDIYIVKSDSLLPKLIEHTGKSFDDISKVSKTDYELDMLYRAIELQKKIVSESSENIDCNIAIIDKIYVQENFRRCKISTWIHTNLSDLIKTFSMLDIAAAILVPGDFSNESKNKFNMDKEEYEQMLINHYKHMGYKNLNNGIMYKKFIRRKKILGIL